jgi:sugar phosphate permease
MQGVMGLDGWKWLFLITGSPAILLGFVVLFALKDSPQQAAWLSSAERDWLVQKLESEKHQKVKSTESSSPAAPAQAASHSVFSNPRVWHLALLYFSLTLGMYGFQLWLPQIIMSFDKLSDASSALLSAIPAIFQALGMILVAAHSDKKRERRWHVACSATLASLSLILCGFSHNPVLSLCLLCLTAFGIWGTVGPFWALPPSYLPASSAAAGIGLINSVGNLGGFAGPYLVGWLKQHTPDFVYSLIALAISLFCGGILALAVKAKSPAEQPEVLK